MTLVLETSHYYETYIILHAHKINQLKINSFPAD